MVTEQFSTKLTDAERERLALLIEECAEVQQIACKILRHGYGSANPVYPDSRLNREFLENELGHIQYAVHLMLHAGDVSDKAIQVYHDSKKATIKQWLHFQETLP